MTPIALTIAGSNPSGGGGHHCGTGQGVSLVAAIEPAKRYITRAVETYPSLGRSVGPVNHNAQSDVDQRETSTLRRQDTLSVQTTDADGG